MHTKHLLFLLICRLCEWGSKQGGMQNEILLSAEKMHKCFSFPNHNTALLFVMYSNIHQLFYFAGNRSTNNIVFSLKRRDDIRNLLYRRCIRHQCCRFHREIIEKMLINILGNFASFHINLFFIPVCA